MLYNKLNKKITIKSLIYTLLIFTFVLISIPTYLYFFHNRRDNSDNNIESYTLDKKTAQEYVYLNNRENYIILNAEDFVLENYYGNSKTMLIFTASWCKYCVEQQEELNNFIINNPDKKVIMISHDKTFNDVKNYLETNNLNWFVVFDKDKIIRSKLDPSGNGIPSVYLLDKLGDIIGYKKGKLTKEGFEKIYNNEVLLHKDH